MKGMEQGRPSILDVKEDRKGWKTRQMRSFHPAEPGPKAGCLSRGHGKCLLRSLASLASEGTQATCPFLHSFCKYLLSLSYHEPGMRPAKRAGTGSYYQEMS